MRRGGQLDVDNGDPRGPQNDLQMLAEACREKNLGSRWEKLGQVLDMDRFLSSMAVEVLVCHRYCSLHKDCLHRPENDARGKVYRLASAFENNSEASFPRRREGFCAELLRSSRSGAPCLWPKLFRAFYLHRHALTGRSFEGSYISI
jgi:hypothetical protein